MVRFDPTVLSRWSLGEWTQTPCNEISGFSIDSRKLNSGDLFIALRAERDGHGFLNQAASAGAVGGLVEYPIEGESLPQLVVDDSLVAFQTIAKSHRNEYQGTVVGVTGSCGKTSTKEILNLLLPQSLCTEGNLNNYLGVPLTLCRLSSEIHKFAVVEAGINQPDEMSLLADMIRPDVTLFTSINHSHLQGLGNVETVAREKAKLWLDSEQCNLAIFPDSVLEHQAFSDAIAKREDYIAISAEKAGAEPSEQLVLYCLSTETNERGYSQSLTIKRCGCPPLVVDIPEVSDGIISNMVLAAVTAWKLGVSDQEISERLPQYRPSGLRGTRLVGRGCSYVVDCYNANPASMIDSVSFFCSQFKNLPKLLVLGGMNELGDSSELLHQKTGEMIFLGPNDRAVLIGKDASHMASGMIQNGAQDENITLVPETESARSLIQNFKGAVLLKGSRSYRLEKLVPSGAVEEGEQMKLAC